MEHDSPPVERVGAVFHLALAALYVAATVFHLYAAWQHSQRDDWEDAT